MRKIEPVKNNLDKRQTYREHTRRYNAAIQSECYFEAILIAYSMMEDRLRSYLYYLGCLKSRKSHDFDNEQIKNDILLLMNRRADDTANALSIDQISKKINIVKSVQDWF